MFIFLGFSFGDLEVHTSHVSKVTNLLPSPVNTIEGAKPICVLKTERIGEDGYKEYFLTFFPPTF